jgi:hypothetical protein
MVMDEGGAATGPGGRALIRRPATERKRGLPPAARAGSGPETTTAAAPMGTAAVRDAVERLRGR